MITSHRMLPEHYIHFASDAYIREISIVKEHFTDALPIVFDPGFNITFFGLENLHPFDTKKYGRTEYIP